MPHETALLLTIAGAFAAAFLFGFAANRLGFPPLVGYLLAGMLLGPHSPGYVADVAAAQQLAEIGVILLMFGVGLHFSLGDLLRVRRVVVPGALLQMPVAALCGYLLARAWAWTPAASLVFGVALSVASTVVVLRTLEDRGMMDSLDGRLAVGWLVVGDLLVVLVLVLLPVVLAVMPGGDGAAAATGGRALAAAVAETLAKMAAFVALMLLVGRRAVPWLLTRVARSGSRELFTLAVLTVALGVALGAAGLFGISVALGAFVAGVVIGESDLSHRAAADALPLQDAFAVIFFVSVGMLIDPRILLQEPLRVLATSGVVVLGNTVAVALLLVLLRHPVGPSLRLGAAFGQVGEFSFILAGLGVEMGVLAEEGRSLILAAALVTIVANPALFALTRLLAAWLARFPRFMDRVEGTAEPRVATTALFQAVPRDHVILVGYGRVGRTIGDALQRRGVSFVAIEQDRRVLEVMRSLGVVALYGDATRPDILALAHPETARLLVVATPDPYHAQAVIERARAANPALQVVVRTHGDEEQALFERMGVQRALMGERELAYGMAYHSLRAMGCTDDQADDVIDGLRNGGRMATTEFRAMLPQE
ncbi:MAG: cation:proton antiporter [Gemmatimonadetes bacterium]|nr:cation:proton antiporter [Gemmatimonadota bacterium]